MPEITVNVKSSNDQKYSITIDTSKTVLEFKKAIAEKCDTAAERQRLIYAGKVLKDNDTLETYKIAEGNTVHMVKGAVPAGMFYFILFYFLVFFFFVKYLKGVVSKKY